MSDVKRYDAGNLTTGEVVMAADYDAMQAAYQDRWERARDLQGEMDEVVRERDQLRAELAAIRGQEPIGYISETGMERVKAGRSGAVAKIKTVTCCHPLYALPPQQPDAVSVPRELLVDLLCGLRITRDRAIKEIRTLFLSTRQAEEGE